MKIECPCCGEELPDLPEGVTEQQARQALLAVILWYQESPIREIQMAEAACGRQFPVKEIEAALQPERHPQVGTTAAPNDGSDIYRGPQEPNRIAMGPREARKRAMQLMSPPSNPDKRS